MAIPALVPVERPEFDEFFLDGLLFDGSLDLPSLDEAVSGLPVAIPPVAVPPVPVPPVAGPLVAVGVAEVLAGEVCVLVADAIPLLGVCEAAASREYEAETDRIEDTTSSFFRTMNPREGTVFRVSTKAALEELTGFIRR
jgi:hypothetical protein